MSQITNDGSVQQPITMTDSAKQRLKILIMKKNDSSYRLRIRTVPGGCSGLSYQMSLDNIVNANDIAVDFEDGAGVVIDNDTLTNITGSVIDFEETLLSSQFTVNNPLAVHSCNCGLSFNTAANKGSIKRCT